MDYIIFDGHGYFVRRRRSEGRVVDIWSPKLADAARFHFIEVAEKFAASFPQKTRIMRRVNSEGGS